MPAMCPFFIPFIWENPVNSVLKNKTELRNFSKLTELKTLRSVT